MTQQEREAFREALGNIRRNKEVQEMKRFRQHGSVSTFAHCEAVTIFSYAMARRLRLRINLKTLLQGAMLHDFYLYDWHAWDGGAHKRHGFHHAEKASQNAARILDADSAVCDVIRTHMWPLNLTKVPRSREAWIVCAADKIVSIRETLFCRQAR